MTTSALIDLIVNYVGTQLTRANALESLNNAQNELLVWNNWIMRVKPDPFITTVDSTFEYVASTSIFKSTGGVKGTVQYDIANVAKIYSFTKQNGYFGGYGRIFYGGNTNSNKPYTLANARTSREVDAPFDVIKSLEPSNEDCIITWWEQNDPGNTTVDWRCECYRWPDQLSSEKIPLSMPAQFQDTLLLWSVLKRLGIQQYGTSNIDNLIIPEDRSFRSYAKSGGRSDKKSTEPVEV